MIHQIVILFMHIHIFHIVNTDAVNIVHVVNKRWHSLSNFIRDICDSFYFSLCHKELLQPLYIILIEMNGVGRFISIYKVATGVDGF